MAADRSRAGCGASPCAARSTHADHASFAVDGVPETGFTEPVRDPALHAAVQSLSPQRRLVVFLRYYADLGYEQIAEVVGIAPGTVAATLSQAHAQLGAALRTEEVVS